MNRRKFLAAGSVAAVATGMRSAVSQSSKSAVDTKNSAKPLARPRGSKPNILLLMADQLRMDCVGAYGNNAIKTPNLDRLAREGVRFQNAYSTTPSCTPARTALLTGLGPWNHGMLGYSNMASKHPYPVEKASALDACGYYTASIGKNHYYPMRNAHGYRQAVLDESTLFWWDKAPEVPNEERCDYEAFFWSNKPANDPHATGIGWNDYRARPFVYSEDLHPTTWTGQTAVKFIDDYDRPEPLFLKVSFIRPHSPYDAPKRFFDMYENVALPEARAGKWADRYIPRSDDSYDIWHGKLPAEVIRHSRQGYYGGVSHVDEQIGEVLQALERRNMLDDTLILFISDHGDMLGDQNLWRKTYAYEPSAHIPMLLRAPSGKNWGHAGQVIDQPVELRDVLPTFIEAAGSTIPKSVEGHSLLHLFREGGGGWREYIDLEHNLCYGPTNHWNGLTDGKWKYIYHAYDGEEQLFHLVEDPHEENDVAKHMEHNDQLLLWRERLIKHLAERGDDWVRQGKLVPRPKSMPFSPNFPGYAPGGIPGQA